VNRMATRKGKLYCIGIGPGDGELVTLKAVRLIRESPKIFVPVTSRASRSLALGILNKVFAYLGESRRDVVELVFPMTRDAAVLEDAWEGNAGEIARSVADGSDCCYVVLGDPMVYSTFGHIHEKLKEHGVDVEFVPGVSSVTTCAAKTGTLLAEGSETILIGTPERLDLIKKNLGYVDTFVILKTAVNVPGLIRELEASGLEKGARVVYARRSGMEGERYIESPASKWPVDQADEDYFSMLIIRADAKALPRGGPQNG